jgi:hypothetical protein
MALTSTGFYYSITLVDEDLNETTKEYKLNSADYTAAVLDGAAIITALLNVTEAKIAKTAITQKFNESALVPPTNDMPVSEVVSVTTLIDGAGTKKANYDIPMPKDVIMTGNALTTSNAAVIAYHALFQTGGVALISDGEVAGVLQKGVRVTHARRYRV